MLHSPVVLAALLLAGGARAAPVFTDEGTVLASSASIHDVEVSSDGYRAYLVQDEFRVLSATSADGRNWTLEGGVRLSTETNALDHSSITAVGVAALGASTGPFRMFYVGISSFNTYSILTASSTDGLLWFKESTSTPVLQSGSGAFLGSPAPYRESSTLMRLYYVRDQLGGNDPAQYRVFSASGSSEGRTLTEHGLALSAQAFHVAVATLSDARVRLFYTATLGAPTTGSAVLTAVGTTGTSFTQDTRVVLSTASATATLSHLDVARSTESHRWRLFSSYLLAGSTIPIVRSAVTLNPVVDAISPTSVFQDDGATGFAAAGEIFGPGPSAAFTQGATSLPGAGVTVASDLSLSFTATPTGAPLGFYSLDVTNADGRTGSLANALLVDFKAAQTSLLDNLFRPLNGQSLSINVVTFAAGQIVAKVYTLNGEFVATPAEGTFAAGANLFTWNGTTTLGNTVASGVYLLHLSGPKLDEVHKVIVIK